MRNFSYLVFMFLLMLAAMTLGFSGPWTKALIEGLSFLVIFLYMLRALSKDNPLYLVPGLTPLLFFLGYIFLQLLPLPPYVLKLVSPKTWEVYNDTIWIVRPDIWMPLSIAPRETVSEFFRIASGVAFYMMTVQLMAERERLKKTVRFMSVFFGLLSVAWGLFHLLSLFYLLSNGLVVGFPTDVQTGPFRGFASSPAGNHYAGLMAMILPLVLAQFLSDKPLVNYASFREKIVEFIRTPSANPHMLLGSSLTLVAVSIFLSLSRTGILSALGALVFFCILRLARGRSQKKGSFMAIVMVAISLVVALLGVGTGLGLFDRMPPGPHDPVAAVKQTLWQDSVVIMGDFPLFGTGLGTFGDIYPRYKRVQTGTLTIDHAYSEYLEVLAGGGLVGGILITWFLFCFLFQTVPVWWKLRSRTSIYLYLGALSGLVAILLHSISDVALSVEVIGIYFFFFAGLAVAAVNGRSDRRGGEPALAKASFTSLRWVVVSMVSLLLFGLVFNVGGIVGKMSHEEMMALGLEPSQPTEGARGAQELTRIVTCFDPLEASYRYAQGDAALALGQVYGALDLFAVALRLKPLDGEYLQRIGVVFDGLGHRDEAERLLQAGVVNDSSNPKRHRVFAFWLLERGNIKKGLAFLRGAILWEPQRTREILSSMASYGLGDSEMAEVLPRKPLPLLAYGDYLVEAGRISAAEDRYGEALGYAMTGDAPNRFPFLHVSGYYTERERDPKALEVVLMGIETFPGDAEFRRLAAHIYERLGINYRAIEEYRVAIALDPGDLVALHRLNKLTQDSR